MGNGTVIAGLIAQGRGGRDRLGQVCLALASVDFGGVAARQWLASARPRLG
jgi:hypothetical protein